jgi:hypothetical protein
MIKSGMENMMLVGFKSELHKPRKIGRNNRVYLEEIYEFQYEFWNSYVRVINEQIS